MGEKGAAHEQEWGSFVAPSAGREGLDEVHVRFRLRLPQAISMDEVVPMTGEVGHSTSVLDVFSILNDTFRVRVC